MTQSNTNRIRIKGVKSKKIQMDFSGGRITSDAGVILLRQAETQTKFIRNLSRAIDDDRHHSYVKHSVKTMMTQRIFGIACGYEDGNDHQQLREDPMFQIAANQEPETEPLAGPSTLCRFEQSITRKDLIRMSKGFVNQFIKSYKSPPKELVLDFDATDDRIHGKQEQAFFHGYYYHYCYLPLYVFCNDQLIVPYLRPSKIDGAKHAWAILSLLVKRFRQVWPKVKILFRADGGFCRHKMLTWCDRNNVEYVVGMSTNNRLRAASTDVIRASQQKAERTQKKVRMFGEIRYGAKTWKTNRRVIVKAEQLELGENIRFVVTNIRDRTPKHIYDGIYVQRGEMENRIKEQQLALFADRTSCHRFLANQFRLLLSSAAYVLMEHIRRVALKATQLAAAQCQTIRTKLLKIGAVILYNSRRIQIKMSAYFVYKKLFESAIQRLT